MNLIEAWEYLENNRGAVLYVKTEFDEGYGFETVSVVETLSIFRDQPYTDYHSGEYPSYFDQDDYGDNCRLYDRHILGKFYLEDDF